MAQSLSDQFLFIFAIFDWSPPTENVDVECAGGSLQTFQDILSFGNKNVSGIGELVILKNVNQTSFVMHVALKTSLEDA